MYVYIYVCVYMYLFISIFLWILDKSIEIKQEGYYKGN